MHNMSATTVALHMSFWSYGPRATLHYNPLVFKELVKILKCPDLCNLSPFQNAQRAGKNPWA